MTSALVLTSADPAAPPLALDLESVGIPVRGAAARGELVRQVIRSAPDVLVGFDAQPDEALFTALKLLAATAPVPVVLFTNDQDAARIELALHAGVHAYVVQGYQVQRLRPTIHLAQARFRHEQSLREQLDKLSQRFEERKLVDRAKGILMRARQMSEDEAFRALRTASMHSNRRVGEVSQQVIEASRHAEAINRAGQLRMLSQRLVKCCALLAGDDAPAGTAAVLDESRQRVEKTLVLLGQTVSRPTFGDLLEAVAVPWAGLREALAGPLQVDALPAIDALAEALLREADRLTAALEAAGYAPTLHVINVSGRQRMLSQRLAKQALLSRLLGSAWDAAAAARSRETGLAFQDGLGYLEGLPLTSREIRAALEQAAELRRALALAIDAVHSGAGRAAIADISERLLALFDRLTDQYERSMQLLMG